ncbi:MAG: helix-turn-helix domain-containing protein [Chloroflexi bacterium]|nr:helix-turn-helix domain-containing protein [Chloroflexota bacterium]
MTSQLDDLLTLPEAAALLRLSKATIQKWAKGGQVPAVKIGKSYRIRRRDLEAWYEALRTQSEGVR